MLNTEPDAYACYHENRQVMVVDMYVLEALCGDTISDRV